ncbi:MAG: ATP:corrinoid adenosyltransferase BtuR/CobO/CobP [Herbinix sp.]|jgi:cob(I)alamin adenosyltransferase|nr:ATP:corrinoid adenosyltransferase BtuR/CobO/CobP [Herbinix sp.]
MKSLIHIYTGDGKGKTTAAIGLSIRFIGNGGKVLFTQFLKDNKSSELSILNNLDDIELLLCEETFGFYSRMNEQTKERAEKVYREYLNEILEIIKNKDIQMLIMDEVIGAYNYNLIDKDTLLTFLKNKPEHLEVVMTGRNPEPELIELADYVSEIVKVKHPFDQGIYARMGIEK